jgi:DNA-binding NarL/FixJ family response regulator
MLRVATVSPEGILQLGLRALLESCATLSVTAAATAHQAKNVIKTTRPDVILTCLSDTGESILLLRHLHQNGKPPAILVLTDHLSKKDARRLLLHGASGILLKKTAGDHLHWAVPALTRGAHVLPPEFSGELILEYLEPSRLEIHTNSTLQQVSGLSRREREILALVGDGLSNPEIGAVLSISSETVKDHLSSLYAKLRVKNRMQAARMAWQCNGLGKHLTGSQTV